MNLSPLPFNLLIVILASLAGLTALALLIKRGSAMLPRRVNSSVTALRTMGFICLLMAILNPYWKTSKPDPGAYKLAVLVDTSRSMETRDLPGDASRLDWVSDWLIPGNGSNPWQSLADTNTPVSVQLFSSQAVPWNGVPVDKPLPGQTAIGDALANLYPSDTDPARTRLGGVLLLSDGINLAGSPTAEAALRLGREGIPVSVIGVGQATPAGDVSIGFTRETQSFREGESAEVGIQITNTFSNVKSGRLTVYRNAELLDERALELQAGESRTESIRVEQVTAGIDTFRAIYKPEIEEGNPATNVSFSIAEVERSDHYRILLITESSGWQPRLLRILALENDNIEMDSLIRIDKGRFFMNSRPEADLANATGPQPVRRETLDALPEIPDFYRSYDALIIDLSIATEFGEALTPILEEFSGTKGGGILLLNTTGPSRSVVQLPASLRPLFPAREFTNTKLETAAPLVFEPNPFFTDYVGGVLFSTPAPLLPPMSSLGIAGEMSRAAQVPARLRESGAPLLVTQAYGAGRTAWLASDALWKWRFGEERSSQRYASFWEALLAWLAVGGKDRLQMPINATILSLDEVSDLAIDVLGQDYTPRMDATVTALLTDPDGAISTHRLMPSVDQPGQYTRPLELDRSGTWQVDYKVVFPDGDELAKTAWFAVAATSPENRQTTFREKPLRDLARLSGGEYRSFVDWQELAPLKISPNIPTVEQRVLWTRTWPFLILAMLLFIAEWWLRRRHGLR